VSSKAKADPDPGARYAGGVYAERTSACPSALAFDGHVERCAHVSHAVVAESPEALYKDPDRHALDGVEIDRGSTRDWIVVWL
jgi:hypothetical protein